MPAGCRRRERPEVVHLEGRGELPAQMGLDTLPKEARVVDTRV